MSEILDKANEFATQYIQPVAQQLDEEAAFPQDIFTKLHEEGYLELLVPEDLGGLGGDVVDLVEVTWAFAKESATVGLTYLMHNVASVSYTHL